METKRNPAADLNKRLALLDTARQLREAGRRLADSGHPMLAIRASSLAQTVETLVSQGAK